MTSVQPDDESEFIFQCSISQLSDDQVTKKRVVALTDKKNKPRIVRIKDGHVTKQWALEDIKSITMDNEIALVLDMGKTFKWVFENAHFVSLGLI